MKNIYIRFIFLSTLIVLIFISLMTYRNLNNYINEVKLVRHSSVVFRLVENVLSAVKDAETGHRGFQLTKDSSYLEPYHASIRELPDMLRDLDSLVQDNFLQSRHVDTLQLLINDQYLLISRILSNAERSSLYMDRYESKLLKDGKENMTRIRNVISRIRSVEEELYTNRIATEEGYRNIAPFSLLAFSIISVFGVAFLFSRVMGALDQKRMAEIGLKENLKTLEREVSEKQFAQRTIQNILDHSLDGIMAFSSVRDEQGEIVDFQWLLANFISAQTLGRGKGDLAGKRLLDVVPDAKKSGLFQIYKGVVDTSVSQQFEREFDFSGEVRWFYMAAVKLDDGLIVTYTDVTEKNVAESRLTQYAEELKRSNQDLEQFAYVASHDLQEPLRKIRAFGDRLAARYEDKLDEVGVEYISRMQQASARMQKLIEDLLSFSRISSGHDQFARVDLTAVVNEVVDDIEGQILREKAKVGVREIAEITGDRGQIRRLFQNLISNAIKFHKPGALPVVEIFGSVVTGTEAEKEFGFPLSESSYVRIVVKDNGIGFDEKYAEKIFNIFQRLQGRAEYEGTGIGLAICRKIMSNHRGYIRAQSVINEGSEFILIFPYAR
ncbi:MAG: CHASE3 domain-containing protein [Cyclobacteriaceae bacterium]|nr:CHASE3 domain-containing protein [Cyclobacteriaceae bacterium]